MSIFLRFSRLLLRTIDRSPLVFADLSTKSYNDSIFVSTNQPQNTFNYLQLGCNRAARRSVFKAINPRVQRRSKYPHVIKWFCVTFARCIQFCALYKINGTL